VRELVTKLEQTIIDFLSHHQISAYAKCKAPGVYIDEKKICSIGLRIRKGCTYHGIAFNVAMDLKPFKRIHPCGFADLQMTQLVEWYQAQSVEETARQLIPYLTKQLNYAHETHV
jgi:lipoyl(octanoyl) transferase